MEATTIAAPTPTPELKRGSEENEAPLDEHDGHQRRARVFPSFPSPSPPPPPLAAPIQARRFAFAAEVALALVVSVPSSPSGNASTIVTSTPNAL